MIHSRRLGGKPGNIARYYTIGDYYTKGGNEPSEWGGKIAAGLGLSGPIDRRAFEALLAGKVEEQQLGRIRHGEVQHHPGRSEERRVGKEWVSTCRSRWAR